MEEEKIKNVLSTSSQRFLISQICGYIESEHSLISSDIENVCRAAISLFPSLKINNSLIGGIVCAFFLYCEHCFALFFNSRIILGRAV